MKETKQQTKYMLFVTMFYNKNRKSTRILHWSMIKHAQKEYYTNKTDTGNLSSTSLSSK